MERDRTELTWTYEPADFFEVRYERDFGRWRLSLETGQAVASMAGGQPSQAIENEIARLVKSVFQTRALQRRQQFKLEDRARVVEFRGDKRNIFLRLESASIRVTVGQVDAIVRSADGTIIRDTRAERIASEKSEVDDLSAKAQQSATLRRMLESFQIAIDDPENELTHLYEIRDALGKTFGSDKAAKDALGIGSSQWSTFGQLANDEPLLEGRHRGKHANRLRHATPEELSTVREMARDWIRIFAATLP
jgi:hypothetical protein